AASFQRNREFHADRFAVEAYGKQPYAEALIVAHLEGSFFSTVAMPELFNLARQHRISANIYQHVGAARQDYDSQNPGTLRKVLGQIMTEKSSVYDSHPSLGE